MTTPFIDFDFDGVPTYLPQQPYCDCYQCRKKKFTIKRAQLLVKYPFMAEIPYDILIDDQTIDQTERFQIRLALIEYYKRSEKFKNRFNSEDYFISVVKGTHAHTVISKGKTYTNYHFNIRIKNLNHYKLSREEHEDCPAIHCIWDSSDLTRIFKMTVLTEF